MKVLEHREQLHSAGNQRRHQEIDESVLRAWTIDLVAVVQHANRESKLFLLITLSKELLKHAPSPLLADLEGFQRIRYICKMQEELHPLELVPNQHVRLVPCRECYLGRLGFAYGLLHLVELVELLDHVEMMHIIGVKDGGDASLAGVLEVLFASKLKNVCLSIAGNVEELGTVHVLQGRLVIIPKRHLVPGLHQEGVCLPEVAEIVAKSSN
mmetsp:Transcript_24630/g.43923  ORF Transcript_24630/g.43923 Transcript_24630/m.43923 type:complete len:212 (-) Transcript_24630:217-852(-)